MDTILPYSLVILLVVIIILVSIIIYILHGNQTNSGGGENTPNPCKSVKMPMLAPGVQCQSGSNGQFAWLSTLTPATTGIAPPNPSTKIRSYPATDSSCITENICQSYCTGDNSCSLYIYDSSSQIGSKNCPSTGSICTTYSGKLPTTITSENKAYVTGGIPATFLPKPHITWR